MSTGLELAGRYAREVVGPLLDRHLPDLPYAVGRLGTGSDVLGLDDETSRDHDWGLRLTLLLAERDAHRVAQVGASLEAELPETAYGLPVRFATTDDPVVRHRVEVTTASALARSRLGVDPLRGLATDDWLALTGQAVLELVAGAVFVDPVGEITRTRAALAWYPDDLWRVLVAVDWQRLAAELPLAGRAGQRGDELGSRLVAARLADVALHLGFLLERRWAPYAKWRGLVFRQLPAVGGLADDLLAAVASATWQEREALLADVLRALHDRQRAVGLPAVDTDPLRPFWDRPFLQPRPDVVELLLASVADPEVRRRYPVGSVEQVVGAVDVLVAPHLRARVSRAGHALG